MKEKVLAWIRKNFHIESLELEDFPVLPGGVIIRDSNNETMLVYWDIMTQKVKYEFS